jgi:hypothetical protein
LTRRSPGNRIARLPPADYPDETMRRSSATALPGPEPTERHDWQTLKSLFPFIWAYKGRVIFALCCLLAA